MRLGYVGILIYLVLGMAACNINATSPISDQLARGKLIYSQGCALASCHGVDGEGITADGVFRVWPLVGNEFQQRNPNAEVIFDVVRSGGEPGLRALTDQQIYDAIAYELSLNDVNLSEPLTSSNALFLSSGEASKEQKAGTLFPPPDQITLMTDWTGPVLPAVAKNKELSVRLTQIALASSVNSASAPAGSAYVLAVFTFDIINDQPVEVSPQYLALVTQDGVKLEASDIHLGYPITGFYPQTIIQEHGTSVLSVFMLPKNSLINHIIYAWPIDDPLILYLYY